MPEIYDIKEGSVFHGLIQAIASGIVHANNLETSESGIEKLISTYKQIDLNDAMSLEVEFIYVSLARGEIISVFKNGTYTCVCFGARIIVE